MLKLCGFDPWMAISNIMSGFGDSTFRRQRLLSPSSLSDMQTTDRRCCSVDSLSGRMLNLAIFGPELKEGATTTLHRVKMRLLAAQYPACRAAFLLTERMEAWPTVNLTHRVGGRPDTVNGLVYETSTVVSTLDVSHYSLQDRKLFPHRRCDACSCEGGVIELWKL